MFVTVLSHDAGLRSLLDNSLRGLGIAFNSYPSACEQSLRADSSRVSAGEHLVLYHISSPRQDCPVIGELLRMGQGRFRVVGVGGSLSADRLLEVIRAGAMDYLDIQEDHATQLSSILNRMQCAQPARGHTPVYLPIMAPSGGCGATFVAANLACALATLGSTVCALDLKLCGGDLAALLKLTPRHTFQSLARKGDDIDATMLKECLVRHECGVQLLASPEPFSETLHKGTAYLKRIVETAGQTYSYVLYEVEGCLFQETIELLKLGDQIIVPLRMDFISVYRAKRYLEFLLRSDVPRDRILLVASRAGRSKDLLVEKVEEVLGIPVRYEIPEDPELVNASVNIGTPVTLTDPQSAISQRIFELAKGLAHQTEGESHRSRSRWWSPMHTLASILGSRG